MANPCVARSALLIITCLIGSTLERTKAKSVRPAGPRLLYQEDIVIGAALDFGSFAGITNNLSSFDFFAFSEIRYKERRRRLADFDWEIVPTAGYPIINFQDSTSTNEIRFRYDHGGLLLPGEKSIQARLLSEDCSAPASTTALGLAQTWDTTGQQFTADVNVLQATVTSGSNPEYRILNSTTAQIKFCIRVDYYWYGAPGGSPVSINYNENIVTVAVDLSTGFSLTNVNMVSTDATSSKDSTAITCNIQAYLCDDKNAPLPISTTTFTQGQIMSACVEVAQVDRSLYHITSVLDMKLEQTKSDGARKDSSDIVVGEQLASFLSDKSCRNGICNIRHFLESKYFDEPNPGKLVVSGTAVCALGPLTLYTQAVGKDLTPAFQSLHNPLITKTMSTVQACQDACTENPDCQVIRVLLPNVSPSGYQCSQYDVYPKDSELEATTVIGVEVFLLNDRIKERLSRTPSPTRLPRPIRAPSAKPSRRPNTAPSAMASRRPHTAPSAKPSLHPHLKPFSKPSRRPSQKPFSKPSRRPSKKPSSRPSRRPSKKPSSMPSRRPSSKPSRRPQRAPSASPSRRPSKPSCYFSCSDAYSRGYKTSGVYTICPTGVSGSASQVYCDQVTAGGGWMLTYAYAHLGGTGNGVLQGGTNKFLVPNTIPLNPTTGFSHFFVNKFAGYQASHIAAVRFYCTTTAHSRIMNFINNSTFVRKMAYDGNATGNNAGWWKNATYYTLLSGHTGNNPKSTNIVWAGATDGFHNFPFMVYDYYYWSIGGQSRWLCDDVAAGYAATTLHNVFVRI